MKICNQCGEKNFDVYTTCTKCGAPLQESNAPSIPNQKRPLLQRIQTTRQESSLSINAKVWMIIGSAANAVSGIVYIIFWILFLASAESLELDFNPLFAGLGLLGGAWLSIILAVVGLMMTVSYFRKINEREPVRKSFRICTLIFVNIVAGILLLCDNGEASVPKAKTQQTEDSLRAYKELFDQGVISKEDFDKKKDELFKS